MTTRPGTRTAVLAAITVATALACDTGMFAPTHAIESIRLLPEQAEIDTRETVQFTVVGMLEDGSSTDDVDAEFHATGGTIDDTGLFDPAGTEGPIEVFVVSPSLSLADTSSVMVAPPPHVVQVELAPDSAGVEADSSISFTPTVTMSDGTILTADSLQDRFESGDSSVLIEYSATGGSVTKDGKYRAGSRGGRFRVVGTDRLSGESDTSTVDVKVVPSTIVAIRIAPDSVTVGHGDTLRLSAAQVRADGKTTAIPAVWSAPAGAIDSAGLFTAPTVDGPVEVTASDPTTGLVGTATVFVSATAPTLVDVEISPDSATVGAGSQHQFSARGRMSDGTSSPVTVSWTADVGNIDGAGLYTAPAVPGTYHVIGSKPAVGMADTSTVTVTAPVAGVVISPRGDTLDAIGDTAHFTASAVDSTGQPLAGVDILWTSQDTSIAKVDSMGRAISRAVGTAVITASVVCCGGDFNDSAGLDSRQIVASVSVSPHSPTVDVGQTTQLTATAVDANGNTIQTASFNWSTSDPSIATVSGGLVEGVAAGDAVISASVSGVGDSADVHVNGSSPTLSSISVSPATATVTTGGTRQFSASGTLSDGSSTSVSVSWSATGGSVNSSGLYTAGSSAGSYQVIASHSSGLADTAAVTIQTQATLTSISVSPSSASVVTGGSVQFGASGNMSDGSSTSVSVTWSATGGSIDGSGNYSAGSSTGSYVAVATHSSGLTDTATISIFAPGQIPTAYSLARPELQSNPGALVAGDDWQSYSSSADIAAEFTHEPHWGTQPVQCGTVNLVSDPVFGQVPQGQHNDGSTNCKPNEVRYGKSFPGAERTWVRVLWKAEANYDDDSFWKFIWSGTQNDGSSGIRHLEWYKNTSKFVIGFHPQGGTECGDGAGDSCVTIDTNEAPLSSDPNHMSQPTTATTDQEWWEYIFSHEVLRGAGSGGGDLYRLRMWARPLTTNNGATLSGSTPAAGPGDYVRKIALESDGANILTDFVDHIWLGINRNDPTSPGHTNYFRWGPWEIIDATVIADPYNLGDDMLR